MPAAKKRTEMLVGLFIFIGLAMLGGLILQFGKFRDRLRGHYGLTIVFDDASGVIRGSEVRMGGAKIGEVASLPELNEAVKVEVELTIKDTIHIPAGSGFQINSATLLGDKLIVVVPSDDRSGDFIQPGSRITGAGPTGLDALQNSAEIVANDVRRLLKQAEATLTKADDAIDDIHIASHHLGESAGKINSSLLAGKNLAHIDTTLENLAAASAKWRETSAQLDPAISDAREAVQAIKDAAEKAEKTLANADAAIADARPALKRLPAAVDNFSGATRKAGAALDRMADGEGMLGALSTDNDVALDFKAFMRNLRQNGILRYRDGAGKGSESQGKSRGSSPPGRPSF